MYWACEIIGDRGVHNFRAPRNPLDSRDRHDLFLDPRLIPRSPRFPRRQRDPRDALGTAFRSRRSLRDATADSFGTRGPRFAVHRVHPRGAREPASPGTRGSLQNKIIYI
ncbi:unnamed protein product [Trichogramma brassicae]|uniref:Uncharacterized protein n=1 Tax=Trichogramma brassicae TaxID=86971 RepID=A0A6H5IKQ5_9HYME|nr:unnamed protein product [Trichogramma brassicae]